MSIDNAVESQDKLFENREKGHFRSFLDKAKYAVMIPVISFMIGCGSENKTTYSGHGRKYEVDPAVSQMIVKTGKLFGTGEVYYVRIDPPPKRLNELDPQTIILEKYVVKPFGPFNNETYDDPSGNKVDRYVLTGKQAELRKMYAEDAANGKFKRYLLHKRQK
jgi:hypothetical protein